MRRQFLTILRGLLAAGLLVMLVAGPPLALVREVGWPLPSQLPAWDKVTQTLSTGAIEDATIIKALSVLVWLAWANFTAGVVLELVALARRRGPRPVAGLRSAQQLAAHLLATVSVALAMLTRPVGGAVADAGELRLSAAALAEEPVRPLDGAVGDGRANDRGIGHGIPGVAGREMATPTTAKEGQVYEVQRGDTLWDLAEQHLGEGMRWRELRDRNIGRPQPDGSRIDRDTEELQPGWTLLLPAGAAGGGSAAVGDDGGSVTVERGDTLWEIAREELDDGSRWPEVYDENQGRPQPDGATLSDPDLIRPGWVLELPETSVAGASDAAQGEPEEPEVRESRAAEVPAPGPTADAAEERDTTEPEDGGGAAPDRPTLAPDPTQTAPATEQAPGPPPATAAEETGHESGVAVAVTSAAAIAAGIVLTLDRLRRARRRRREPGRRIPLPSGEARRVEQALRGTADQETARFVDLALRELAGAFEAEDDLPRVVLVSYDTHDVAVHLEAARSDAPGGWELRDEGLRWVRPRPDDLAQLEAHGGTPSAFPGLVTIGTLTDERVAMLNLARSHYLMLTGDHAAGDQLLHTWALELATTPRIDGLDVVTVGLPDLPSGLERLVPLAPEQLGKRVHLADLEGSGSPLDIVVLAGDLPEEVAAPLQTCAEMRSDLAAATTSAPTGQGGRTLAVDGGEAVLWPEGIHFRLVELPDETVPTSARLLEQALHDPDQLVPIPDLDGEDDDTDLDVAAVEHTEVEPADPAVDVRVLGPVEIVGNAEAFRTNKTIELIVYLALHRGGADTDTLMEALWPDQEPRPARLYTEASRARKALGTAPDGTPYFPDAELGRYRLSPVVGLDYDRFVAAIEVARRTPDQAERALREALLLVRGVPMSATATEYAWAIDELYRLAQEVVDAAHQLAQLHLEAGRYDDAVWAAEQGLRADPVAEMLVRDLMQAAGATGNTARVHAAMTRLRRQVTEDGGANDADDWLHPETVRTYEDLVGGRRERAGRATG